MGEQKNKDISSLATYVLMGRVRKIALLETAKAPITASFLAKRHRLRRESFSRAFSDLKIKGLVVCVNKTNIRMRFYKTTKKGNEISNEIIDLGYRSI